MAVFRYKAVNRAGVLDVGTLEAADASGAQRVLRGKGLTPVSLMPEKSTHTGSKGSSEAQHGGAKPVKLAFVFGDTATVHRKDVLRFTSELAVLLRAGLPLDKAMRVQIDSAPDGAMKDLLAELLDALKGGKALSVGLATRPEVFDSFYINMVRSGEASGGLDAVLEDLAQYLERSRALRSAVVSALIYPAMLAIVAMISVFVMLGFVVPEFEALFEDMGDSLPLLTEAVIAFGDFIAAWWWLLGALVTGAAWVVNRWFATPEGTAWRDRRSLAAPLLGGIVNRYEVAQFSRTMGTLLNNGVAMLNAADIAIGTVRNSLVRDALAVVAPAIKRGGRLSDAMDSSVFSPVAIQMVRVGEESGSLDAMLLRLADVYTNEVESEIKRALTLLEPLLILGMGGVIALIIVAILMGILSVNQLAV